MHAQIIRRPDLTGRLDQTLHAIRAKLRLATERRTGMARITRELEAHSDQDLADLGLARCDIPRLARTTVQEALPTR